MADSSAEIERPVTSKITATFFKGGESSLTEIARPTGLPLLIDASGDNPRPCIPVSAPRVLHDLCAIANKPARVGVLCDLKVAYIERQPGRPNSSVFTGEAMLPVHPTAVGRALLAFSSAHMMELTIRNGLHRYTPFTITSPERFRRALAVTRLTRVAISRMEFDPWTCEIAMPVFDPAGDVVAAIELTLGDLGPELAAALTALTMATRRLSRELVGLTTGRPATVPQKPSLQNQHPKVVR
jgi:hypothetical protein